ncbi:MAG: glycosyl hydrolase [Terriglobia bacterium]
MAAIPGHGDLEEMKRQGINGVLIYQGAPGDALHSVQFLSPEWHDLFRYALREARRLEIEVSVNVCDGWDSGGPWIAPDEANKKLVYSEVQVDGGRKIEQNLPLPPLVDEYYYDVALLAIREKLDRPISPARVTASSTLEGYVGEWNFPPADAVDGEPETF